jgi:hypothetical protein
MALGRRIGGLVIGGLHHFQNALILFEHRPELFKPLTFLLAGTDRTIGATMN